MEQVAAPCECGNHWWCPLTKWGVTLVSPQDLSYICSLKWSLVGTRKKGFYAKRTIHGKKIHLHCVILQFPEYKIDHKNGNGLDNQRSNMRRASHIENGRNCRKQDCPTSSIYKGVTLIKSSKKWQAAIRLSPSKTKYLGVFKTEVEAACAYDSKATIIFGEFARLNFPQNRV